MALVNSVLQAFNHETMRCGPGHISIGDIVRMRPVDLWWDPRISWCAPVSMPTVRKAELQACIERGTCDVVDARDQPYGSMAVSDPPGSGGVRNPASTERGSEAERKQNWADSSECHDGAGR